MPLMEIPFPPPAKFVVVAAMKACGGSGGVASSHSQPRHYFVTWPLTSQKEIRYLFYRRLGGLQRQSEGFGKEKNILPVQGFEPRILHPLD